MLILDIRFSHSRLCDSFLKHGTLPKTFLALVAGANCSRRKNIGVDGVPRFGQGAYLKIIRANLAKMTKKRKTLQFVLAPTRESIYLCGNKTAKRRDESCVLVVSYQTPHLLE